MWVNPACPRERFRSVLDLMAGNVREMSEPFVKRWSTAEDIVETFPGPL